jgi:predicted transcriptional regulator
MSSPVRAVPNIVGADLLIEPDKVTIKNLVITDSELSSYLSTKEGPEQVLLLLDLIDTAMQIQRMANASADVKELNSVAKQVRETMKSAGDEAFTSLQKLIEDQGENKPGTLINLLKTKLVDQVISELDPSKDTSPFHSINEQLTALLAKSSGEKAKQESYANSREKGIDFEELLDQMIQLEAVVHGDDAQFTGDIPSPSGDKTGDEVVTINPSVTNSEEIRIVWEAKTDRSFKDTKGRLKRDKVASELDDAMTNREAICGVFVSDARGVDLTKQPAWQEFDGNKLIIVLDDENPDQRLIRMAYLWSRWIVLRSQEHEEGELDFAAIERVIASLQREFDGLSSLRRLHTPIRTNILAAEEWVNKFEQSLDGLMDELRDLMTVEEDE